MMKTSDWKEFILYGLGGLLLFLLTGVAAVADLSTFLDGARPLFIWYNKHNPNNELGIIFTLILAVLAIVGLITFVINVRDIYQKLRRKD